MTTSRSSLALPLALLAGPGAGQELTLPSGLPATLYDVVIEAGGGTGAPDAYTDPEGGQDMGDLGGMGGLGEGPLGAAPDGEDGEGPAPEGTADGLARFRLRVEGLGGEGRGYEAVAGDFAWVCETLALPALAANGWEAGEVVVALSDREVEFGRPDPEAVQFFEGFRVAGGACIPQAF